MDSDGRFLWFQHEKGQEIDLAGIEVVGAESEFKFWPPDQTKQLPIRISCGVDTFMLGFPENVAAQDIFPIWKRGTIAAEPSIDRLDQLPIYLVDAATGKGMSGSPTFAYSANGYIDEENNYQFGVSGSRFLGIYSGRYGGIGEANLTMGRVWKAEVVYEMLDKRSPGKVAKSQRSK